MWLVIVMFVTNTYVASNPGRKEKSGAVTMSGYRISKQMMGLLSVEGK